MIFNFQLKGPLPTEIGTLTDLGKLHCKTLLPSAGFNSRYLARQRSFKWSPHRQAVHCLQKLDYSQSSVSRQPYLPWFFVANANRCLVYCRSAFAIRPSRTYRNSSFRELHRSYQSKYVAKRHALACSRTYHPSHILLTTVSISGTFNHFSPSTLPSTLGSLTSLGGFDLMGCTSHLV